MSSLSNPLLPLNKKKSKKRRDKLKPIKARGLDPDDEDSVEGDTGMSNVVMALIAKSGGNHHAANHHIAGHKHKIEAMVEKREPSIYDKLSGPPRSMFMFDGEALPSPTRRDTSMTMASSDGMGAMTMATSMSMSQSLLPPAGGMSTTNTRLLSQSQSASQLSSLTAPPTLWPSEASEKQFQNNLINRLEPVRMFPGKSDTLVGAMFSNDDQPSLLARGSVLPTNNNVSPAKKKKSKEYVNRITTERHETWVKPEVQYSEGRYDGSINGVPIFHPVTEAQKEGEHYRWTHGIHTSQLSPQKKKENYVLVEENKLLELQRFEATLRQESQTIAFNVNTAIDRSVDEEMSISAGAGQPEEKEENAVSNLESPTTDAAAPSDLSVNEQKQDSPSKRNKSKSNKAAFVPVPALHSELLDHSMLDPRVPNPRIVKALKTLSDQQMKGLLGQWNALTENWIEHSKANFYASTPVLSYKDIQHLVGDELRKAMDVKTIHDRFIFSDYTEEYIASATHNKTAYVDKLLRNAPIEDRAKKLKAARKAYQLFCKRRDQDTMLFEDDRSFMFNQIYEAKNRAIDYERYVFVCGLFGPMNEKEWKDSGSQPGTKYWIRATTAALKIQHAWDRYWSTYKLHRYRAARWIQTCWRAHFCWGKIHPLILCRLRFGKRTYYFYCWDRWLDYNRTTKRIQELLRFHKFNWPTQCFKKWVQYTEEVTMEKKQILLRFRKRFDVRMNLFHRLHAHRTRSLYLKCMLRNMYYIPQFQMWATFVAMQKRRRELGEVVTPVQSWFRMRIQYFYFKRVQNQKSMFLQFCHLLRARAKMRRVREMFVRKTMDEWAPQELAKREEEKKEVERRRQIREHQLSTERALNNVRDLQRHFKTWQGKIQLKEEAGVNNWNKRKAEYEVMKRCYVIGYEHQKHEYRIKMTPHIVCADPLCHRIFPTNEMYIKHIQDMLDDGNKTHAGILKADVYKTLAVKELVQVTSYTDADDKIANREKAKAKKNRQGQAQISPEIEAMAGTHDSVKFAGASSVSRTPKRNMSAAERYAEKKKAEAKSKAEAERREREAKEAEEAEKQERKKKKKAEKKEKKRRASVVAMGGDPNLLIAHTGTTTEEGTVNTTTDPENVEHNNGNEDDKSVNSQGSRRRGGVGVVPSDDEKSSASQGSSQTSGRRNAVSAIQLKQATERQNKSSKKDKQPDATTTSDAQVVPVGIERTGSDDSQDSIGGNNEGVVAESSTEDTGDAVGDGTVVVVEGQEEGENEDEEDEEHLEADVPIHKGIRKHTVVTSLKALPHVDNDTPEAGPHNYNRNYANFHILLQHKSGIEAVRNYFTRKHGICPLINTLDCWESIELWKLGSPFAKNEPYIVRAMAIYEQYCAPACSRPLDIDLRDGNILSAEYYDGLTAKQKATLRKDKHHQDKGLYVDAYDEARAWWNDMASKLLRVKNRDFIGFYGNQRARKSMIRKVLGFRGARYLCWTDKTTVYPDIFDALQWCCFLSVVRNVFDYDNTSVSDIYRATLLLELETQKKEEEATAKAEADHSLHVKREAKVARLNREAEFLSKTIESIRWRKRMEELGWPEDGTVSSDHLYPSIGESGSVVSLESEGQLSKGDQTSQSNVVAIANTSNVGSDSGSTNNKSGDGNRVETEHEEAERLRKEVWHDPTLIAYLEMRAKDAEKEAVRHEKILQDRSNLNLPPFYRSPEYEAYIEVLHEEELRRNKALTADCERSRRDDIEEWAKEHKILEMEISKVAQMVVEKCQDREAWRLTEKSAKVWREERVIDYSEIEQKPVEFTGALADDAVSWCEDNELDHMFDFYTMALLNTMLTHEEMIEGMMEYAGFLKGKKQLKKHLTMNITAIGVREDLTWFKECVKEAIAEDMKHLPKDFVGCVRLVQRRIRGWLGRSKARRKFASIFLKKYDATSGDVYYVDGSTDPPTVSWHKPLIMQHLFPRNNW